MTILIGCPIWTHKGWLGTLFPKGTKQGDYLRVYSRAFRTVEGNTTFYAGKIFYLPLLPRYRSVELSVSEATL